MAVGLEYIRQGDVAGIMAIDSPLKLFISRIFEGNKLDQGMKSGALFFTDDFFFKLNNRGLYNKLGLSGKTRHHLVQRIVLNKVLQI